MINVDEFESAFRAADKRKFSYALPPVERVLVISDLSGEEEANYLAAVKKLLPTLDDATYITKGGEEWAGVTKVLSLLDEVKPDLVCTYRNLNSDAWRYSYSLGIYLNALTRGSKIPVVVTPSPHESPDMAWQHRRTDSVLVVTDHLTGDDELTNWGAKMARPQSTLHLMHVEHDEDFDRIIEAISKVPEIDTDAARQTIWAQLLREPTEYSAHAQQVLKDSELALTVVPHVMTGHRVVDYRGLIDEHRVDLVVFPSLEEDRIALHGVAYSLAVELTQVPLLMV